MPSAAADWGYGEGWLDERGGFKPRAVQLEAAADLTSACETVRSALLDAWGSEAQAILEDASACGIQPWMLAVVAPARVGEAEGAWGPAALRQRLGLNEDWADFLGLLRQECRSRPEALEPAGRGFKLNGSLDLCSLKATSLRGIVEATQGVAVNQGESLVICDLLRTEGVSAAGRKEVCFEHLEFVERFLDVQESQGFEAPLLAWAGSVQAQHSRGLRLDGLKGAQSVFLTGATDASLEHLERVEGALCVGDSTGVVLSRLRRAGEVSAQRVEGLRMDRLESVESLAVTGAREVSMERLERVEGALWVGESLNLRLPNLRSVGRLVGLERSKGFHAPLLAQEG